MVLSRVCSLGYLYSSNSPLTHILTLFLNTSRKGQCQPTDWGFALLKLSKGVLSGALIISSWIFWVLGSSKFTGWGKKKKRAWKRSKGEFYCTFSGLLVSPAPCDLTGVSPVTYSWKNPAGDVLGCIRPPAKANIAKQTINKGKHRVGLKMQSGKESHFLSWDSTCIVNQKL